MTAGGARDGKRDVFTIPVRDGIGYQVAGQQDRDVWIDRDLPGMDGRADLDTGLGRRDWFPGQPEATLVQFSWTSRYHRAYPVPQLTYSRPVASKMLLQLAVQDIGQLTDIERGAYGSQSPAPPRRIRNRFGMGCAEGPVPEHAYLVKYYRFSA